MASFSKRKPTQSTKSFHIFNCDKTCSLEQVESLLCSVGSKVDFKIEVKKHSFNSRSVGDLVEKTIPGLRMDYAVFMIHKNDNDLAFTEETRCREIYEELKRRTKSSGDKVLIVIGGDKTYENKEEEQNYFLSFSALQSIKGQFSQKFIDGRKSFIFSWDDRHRPIHEEALLHYFDQSKRGETFGRLPARHAEPMENVQAVTPNASEESADRGERETSDNAPVITPLQPEVNERRDCTGNDTGNNNTGSPTSPPGGTVLLSTRMYYGEISYDTKDATFWNNDRDWRPPEYIVQRLKEDWKSKAFTRLELITDDSGQVNPNVTETLADQLRNNCSIS